MIQGGTSDASASFSNYGDWIELSAPGNDIYTTHYNRVNQTSTYPSTQGTSFASPIAAGAAALVWSAYPDLNYRDVTDTLMTYADNIDEGRQDVVGPEDLEWE